MAFDTSGIYATLTPTTMLWPRLLVAEAFKKDGKAVGDPKYGAAFAFPPDHADLNPLKGKALAVAKAKWPGVPATEIEWPFKSGTKMITENAAKIAANEPGVRPMQEDVKKFLDGKAVLQMRTKKQPQLCKMTPQGIITLEGLSLEQNKGVFYSGVDAIFEVNFWPNTGSKGEKYITAYLNAVVSYNTGVKIAGSGAPPAAERFKGYVGQVTAEDPTRGTLDDEISF